MTPAEMERQLENLDHRLARIEQILPTLATKADLERFATKADLERFATKADLKEGLAQQRAFTESVRDEVRTLAEGQGQLVLVVNAVRYTLDTLVMRLEAKGVI
jgi:hypothetical protein